MDTGAVSGKAGIAVFRRGLPAKNLKRAIRKIPPIGVDSRTASRKELPRALQFLVMLRQSLRRGPAILGDHLFERYEPMVVVGFAGVGFRRPAHF